MKGWSGRCVSRVEAVCMRACMSVCARWIEEVGDCVCVERVECVRVSCVCGGCVVANVHASHIPFCRTLMRVCSPLPRSYGNVFIKRRSSPNTLVFSTNLSLSVFCSLPFLPPIASVFSV